MLPISISLLIIQYVITIFVLGFTDAKSVLRIACLPLVAICCSTCVLACKTSLPRSAWGAAVGGYSVTYVFQYVALALLIRCDFRAENPSSTPAFRQSAQDEHGSQNGSNYQVHQPSTNTTWARLKFGTAAASSFRWIGTKREVKNVPHFSKHDPSFVPTRKAFLAQTAGKILLCYLVIDLMGLGSDEETNRISFSPSRVPLLSRWDEVTFQELLMRTFGTLGAAVGVYCFQEGLQSTLAFIAVGLGISEVEQWRPRFGAIEDAYSVRTFWSLTWHQINRLILSAPTGFVVRDILRLPSHRTITRFVSLAISFFLSGVLHLFVDLASGIPLRDSGSIRFFSMQVVGIVFEMSIAAGLGSSPSLRSRFNSSKPWCKAIGRLWVTLFMIWTVPGWIYPTISRNRSGTQDSALPFSVLANLIPS